MNPQQESPWLWKALEALHCSQGTQHLNKIPLPNLFLLFLPEAQIYPPNNEKWLCSIFSL